MSSIQQELKDLRYHRRKSGISPGTVLRRHIRLDRLLKRDRNIACLEEHFVVPACRINRYLQPT